VAIEESVVEVLIAITERKSKKVVALDDVQVAALDLNQNDKVTVFPLKGIAFRLSIFWASLDLLAEPSVADLAAYCEVGPARATVCLPILLV
jgi:hypothetical protein